MKKFYAINTSTFSMKVCMLMIVLHHLSCCVMADVDSSSGVEEGFKEVRLDVSIQQPINLGCGVMVSNKVTELSIESIRDTEQYVALPVTIECTGGQSSNINQFSLSLMGAVSPNDTAIKVVATKNAIANPNDQQKMTGDIFFSSRSDCAGPRAIALSYIIQSALLEAPSYIYSDFLGDQGSLHLCFMETTNNLIEQGIYSALAILEVRNT